MVEKQQMQSYKKFADYSNKNWQTAMFCQKMPYASKQKKAASKIASAQPNIMFNYLVRRLKARCIR